MSIHRLTLAALLSLACGAAADWPAYQHDARRTGYSDESLSARRLTLKWTWRSPAPPQPAWAGPAMWDAYAGRRDLPSMRSYDLCFQPIAADGRVYFGSSADDTLYCLDASSGGERWSRMADGPIRTAPTLAADRLLFGSDDGHAYCLDAGDGALRWRFRPVESRRRIVNNGRFISLHPCRTGVLVDAGRAYFGCALLPWKEAYLCCVDLETGLPEGAGCFVKRLDDATLEGPPAATSELLVFPQGRVAPRVFQRSSGDDRGTLKGSSGGSLVLVSLDAVFHGPGADSRKGGINRSSLESRTMIATHGRGNAMVVDGAVSYMLTDDAIVCSDLAKKKNRWTVPCEQPYALIGVGDVLIAGGRDEVAAYRTADGQLVWRHEVEGRAYGLAAADGRLLVSTDAGIIHAFEATDTAANPAADRPLPANSEFAPATIQPVDDDRLGGRWVFQAPHASGQRVEDLAGKFPGATAVPATLRRAGRLQALQLDGRAQSVVLADDHRRAGLPSEQITVEAWVRVDQPQPWGGILGAVQDNGSFERGWVLGFRESRFSFALAGQQGNGRLTYLTADEDFEPGQWYHVAGVYDGARLQLFVDGVLAGSSTAQRGPIRYPPRAFFEIGAYHDQDEYFRLKGQLHEVRWYDRALTAREVAEHAAEKADLLPGRPHRQPRYELAAGPWLEFTGPQSAVVRWRSAAPVPTRLEWWLDGQPPTPLGSDAPAKQHAVELTGLRRNRVYRYVIFGPHQGEQAPSDEYLCDTFFNFRLPNVSKAAASDAAATASSILEQARVDQGLCLMFGARDAGLMLELVRQSDLRLLAVDTDAARVRDARQRLRKAGVYGSRATVLRVDDSAHLPLADRSANLIVADLPVGALEACAGEARRMLRPDGGVACLRPASASPLPANALQRWWPQSEETQQRLEIEQGSGGWTFARRAALPGAGEWSHLYGRADNSAFGGEQLAGADDASDLEVQWIGRPGPRFKPDRSGRKPSPLSTGGRLFIQGHHRVAALDAYNGTVLWSLELPHLERFNMPRDCGNWCADRQFVYAAIRGKCWQIAADRGEVVKIHDVVTPQGSNGPFDWGAVISHGDQLIGTAVKQGSSWTDFWGSAGWYDAHSGEATDKICSDNLFSLDKRSGKIRWSYARGVVINSTITVHGDTIYFVESRSTEVTGAPERRVGSPSLWEDQFLVALDGATGEVVWERPLDTVDGSVVFYLAASSDRLVMLASADGHYHLYGYDTDGGAPRWRQSFRWPGGKGDHGKAMSRPAIVGGRVYVRPHVFQLDDGTRLPQQMPGGGCGTYACSASALFFRASRVTMWSQDAGTSTGWDRLRPDCWLSAIPAAGMLLAAEGGGGCSCGTWMETSIGFIPIERPSGN